MFHKGQLVWRSHHKKESKGLYIILTTTKELIDVNIKHENNPHPKVRGCAIVRVDKYKEVSHLTPLEVHQRLKRKVPNRYIKYDTNDCLEPYVGANSDFKQTLKKMEEWYA